MTMMTMTTLMTTQCSDRELYRSSVVQRTIEWLVCAMRQCISVSEPPKPFSCRHADAFSDGRLLSRSPAAAAAAAASVAVLLGSQQTLRVERQAACGVSVDRTSRVLCEPRRSTWRSWLPVVDVGYVRCGRTQSIWTCWRWAPFVWHSSLPSLKSTCLLRTPT